MKIKLFLQHKIENKRGEEFLVIPIPQETNSQKRIYLKIETPIKYQLIKEKKYGNQLLFFILNDVNKEEKIIINTSIICPGYPKLKQIPYKLTDYQKIPVKEKTLFLKPDDYINGQDKKIQILSAKLIGQRKRVEEIIKTFYCFTLEKLRYAAPIKGLYPYKQALEVIEGRRSGVDCGGFSTFFISLLQSQNIPARLAVGSLIKQTFIHSLFSRLLQVKPYTLDLLTIHAWVEILFPDNNWYPFDPSIEWRRKRGLSKRKGGFGYVDNDRIIFSYGQGFKIQPEIEGKRKFSLPLLQTPVLLRK